MPAQTARPFYGVDSMVFVYHFEANPEFGDAAGRLLQAAEQGRCRLVTSVLTLAEVLVVPKRHHADALAARYRELFRSFPNLTVVPIDEAIAERAAGLRAEHNLRTPDALQVATAMREGADAFVTEDRRLRAAKPCRMVSLAQAAR